MSVSTVGDYVAVQILFTVPKSSRHRFETHLSITLGCRCFLSCVVKVCYTPLVVYHPLHSATWRSSIHLIPGRKKKVKCFVLQARDVLQLFVLPQLAFIACTLGCHCFFFHTDHFQCLNFLLLYVVLALRLLNHLLGVFHFVETQSSQVACWL